MELTRSQQQYILDVLAELRGRQLGVDLKFTLKPEQPSDGARREAMADAAQQ